MRRPFFKVLLSGAALSAVMVLPGVSSVAHAATLSCGDIILQNTVLENDVGPCGGVGGHGITIGASNITFDLNGHTISGVPNQVGEGAGIYVNDQFNVTVKNGTVRNFDGGVVIELGHDNTVTAMRVLDNIGSLATTRFGDGIAIMCSQRNQIRGNTAIHNGTFSGIGVYSRPAPFEHPCRLAGFTSTGNVITANIVQDNNLPRNATTNDDDGIRVESLSTNNTISNNTVTGSGLDGISLFSFAPDNVVTGNRVVNNGFLNRFRRNGDGIRVFGGADRSVVERNTAYGNAGNGIILHGPFLQPNGTLRPGARDGVVRYNIAYGNNRLPPIENVVVPPGTAQLGGPTFDLHDGNPSCDNNTWFGNRYGTAFPACTTVGGGQATP